MQPSIKESDRLTGEDRVTMAVMGIALTVFAVTLNVAAYLAGWIVGYLVILLFMGPALMLGACGREYKGNISDVRRASSTAACPQCETMGEMECYSLKAGQRTERQYRGLRTIRKKIVFWKQMIHCRSCGYKGERQAQRQRQMATNAKNIEARDKKIEALLYANNFAEAERTVNEMLRNEPHGLDLMKFLDQSLNGQGKFDEAEEVAHQVRAYWTTHERSQWISQGRPKQGSVHCRLIQNNTVPNYRMFGKQYYEPEKQDDGSSAYFKVLLFPKDPNVTVRSLTPRLFKYGFSTEKGVVSSNCLREHFENGCGQVVKSYDAKLRPSIHEVAQDVAEFVRNEPGKEVENLDLECGLKEAPWAGLKKAAYEKVSQEDQIDETNLVDCEAVELTERSSSPSELMIV